MTKSELVNYIAENTGMKKTEANTVLSIIGKAVQKTIDEHSSVTLPGIGTFSFDVAESRMGRNPQTGEPIEIPRHGKVKFSPKQELKDIAKATKLLKESE